MDAAVWFLIVTMGSHVGIMYQGFGGVSVTPTTSHQQCIALKTVVTRQIQATDNLYVDDDEILVKCEKVDK